MENYISIYLGSSVLISANLFNFFFSCSICCSLHCTACSIVRTFFYQPHFLGRANILFSSRRPSFNYLAALFSPIFIPWQVWYWCTAKTLYDDHQHHHFCLPVIIIALTKLARPLSPCLDLPRLFICLRLGLYQHKLQLVSHLHLVQCNLYIEG